MRKAADNLRARADEIATQMTMEQGKPRGEAKMETLAGADIIDWFAEEGRRTYGRIIPARAEGVYQLEIKEPVGPVAAFTPWNFPINQAVRKISARGRDRLLDHHQGAGRDAGVVRRVWSMRSSKAGLPPGVINLVFGVPAEISSYLIPHPVIRKISFTGSTAVGKQLAMLAGAHMKRVTMELGGHAPAIVFDDADLDAAAKMLSAAKFRNAGQVCVAPTRFLVQKPVYDEFMGKFSSAAKAIKVGDGLEEGTRMGPLAHARRLDAMEAFVSDAVAKGAKVETGGQRIGNKGYFFEPTVLTDVPHSARIMNEEPFGPIAIVGTFDEVRRRDQGGQPPVLWARRLRLHALDQDRGRDRPRDRERHGDDQPPRPRAAGSAVRRREGFGLRHGGRRRRARGLSQHQVRHADECVTRRSAQAGHPVSPERVEPARIGWITGSPARGASSRVRAMRTLAGDDAAEDRDGTVDRNVLILIVRVCLSAVFLYSGIDKLVCWDDGLRFCIEHKMPQPKVVLAATAVIHIVGRADGAARRHGARGRRDAVALHHHRHLVGSQPDRPHG